MNERDQPVGDGTTVIFTHSGAAARSVVRLDRRSDRLVSPFSLARKQLPLGIFTWINRYRNLVAFEIDLSRFKSIWISSRSNSRRRNMSRRFLCLGFGVLALLMELGDPGRIYAQHSRGGSHRGSQPGFNNGFTSGFPNGVTPGFGFDPRFQGRFIPGFGFEPRFSGTFFDLRFSRDHFDPQFDPRFNSGLFDPRFIR
jgi:hypothetical protein